MGGQLIAALPAHILGSAHEDIVSLMCTTPQGAARFAKGNWREGQARLPLLDGALASLECDIISSTTVGTHQFVIGLRDPSLVNFNGGVRHLPERLTA